MVLWNHKANSSCSVPRLPQSLANMIMDEAIFRDFSESPAWNIQRLNTSSNHTLWADLLVCLAKHIVRYWNSLVKSHDMTVIFFFNFQNMNLSQKLIQNNFRIWHIWFNYGLPQSRTARTMLFSQFFFLTANLSIIFAPSPYSETHQKKQRT